MNPVRDPFPRAREFKDGMLTVHLPESASAKPKTIEVTVS
jgi:HSP20 family molecular chaperone IbpA